MLGWERWRWSPNSLGTPNLFFVFLSLNSIFRAPSDVAMSGKIQNLCNVWGKIRLWYEDNLIWQKLHCVVLHFSMIWTWPGSSQAWEDAGAGDADQGWEHCRPQRSGRDLHKCPIGCKAEIWCIIAFWKLTINKHVRMERDMKPRYLSLIFSSCPLLNTSSFA